MDTSHKSSFTTLMGYLDDIEQAIDSLQMRPCADLEFQELETELCATSRRFLTQLGDLQRRYFQILQEEAGPREDNTLSKAQLGLSR